MTEKHKIFSILMCIVILLTGCTKYANEKNFSGNITIPDNGIVEKSIFEDIKSKNSVVTLEGKNNNIKYQWTVFGSDIENARDLDMSIKVCISDGEEISVSLNSKEAFGFIPVLSVYVPCEWKSLTATVCDTNGKKLCGASLTSGNPTIVNFSLTENVFEYIITGDGYVQGTVQDSSETTASVTETHKPMEKDDYLSQGNGIIISDGKDKGKDKYNTDPVPAGQQKPVEPEDAVVNEENVFTCTFSIECTTILNNIDRLKPEKLDVLPNDGIILAPKKVKFYEGESVFDVLQRVCKKNKIHLESNFTPMYNSAYIEGIHNLYEFDCGELSGWMYRVNGWFPNYGCSRYALQDGDVVEWRYTCDLGRDVGCDWNVEG